VTSVGHAITGHGEKRALTAVSFGAGPGKREVVLLTGDNSPGKASGKEMLKKSLRTGRILRQDDTFPFPLLFFADKAKLEPKIMLNLSTAHQSFGILLLPAFFVLAFSAFCRADITFAVEELSKPEKALPVLSSREIYESLIRSDAGIAEGVEVEIGTDFPYNIVAQGKAPDKLVHLGYHSFFQGMYQAYAQHRPFVLSPDMIWLLISQGFARHVNANAEKLRGQFVDFDGKLSLVVASTDVRLDDPNAPWEKIFPQFTQQIARHAGADLAKTLSADFTTTTPVEKIASDITIMEAMKSYFEFVTLFALCGIPEITLQGTPEDWQKVLDKTRELSKYDLGWWTRELEPVLKEFVRASHGKIKKSFWRNMFKYHTSKIYGAPRIIDGWIVKFFPYDKDGNRNNLKEIKNENSLPNEIVKVDMQYVDTVAKTTTPLELWAGFVGLGQDNRNYALTPKIGWMIRKADTDSAALKKIIFPNMSDVTLKIRVKEVPPEILEIREIGFLEITFIDKVIIIPDRMASMKIRMLSLYGKTDATGAQRIKAMFPNTKVFINGK